MRIITILIVLLFTLVSCKPKSNVVTTKSKGYKTSRPSGKLGDSKPKTTTSTTSTNSKVENFSNSKADKIIKKAYSYKGTKYKYGGMSKSGMDCSALTLLSYKSQNVPLPRSSFDQSKKGIKIPVAKARKGDLVFFKTSGKNRITHVGLVVENNKGEVRFIHASTSRGVIVSSLKEGYWKSAFAEARRIL